MSKQRVPTSQVLSGKLSGNPNLIYDIIDNNDVVKAPYMDRMDNGDFALYKRKAYKNILANEDYIGRTFNDALKVRYGQCGSEGLTTYVQATDSAGTAGQILKYFESEAGAVNCLSSLVGDELCICDCQTNRLIPSMGPRGEIKTLPGAVTVSVLGVQDSATVGSILWGRFRIETSAGSGVHEDLTTYSSGSFRYIYAMCAGSATTDGIGGQIRKIVGYNSTDKEWILDAPWTLGTVITDRKNVTFSVFADWGELVNYVDCDGISTIHPDGAGYNVTYACNSEQSGDACIKAMEYFDGRIRFINTEGSLAWGGTGYNTYYFTADQATPIQHQAVSLSAFQNHLIFMGYDFMGAVYKKEQYGLTGYNAFNLSDKVGLRSRDSYLSDDDAFYIVTNDKQLKVVSIVAKGAGEAPGLQFQDVIDVFDGELDRLQKGDEVYINKVGAELRIHIVTQAISQDGITEGSGTKILIYDTKAKLYHTHTVCDQEVTRYENDLYLGSGVFRRCGYEDGGYPDGDGLTTGTVFYDQLISAFIGSNKNNGLTFDVFNPKIIDMVKTDIGPSIITAGNTSLKYIEHRMGYKSQYVIDDWTTVPWIENMNTIAAGNTVSVDECMLNDMQDCQSIVNLCEDGVTQVALPANCNCSGEYYLPREYCVCHEDTSYMLSLTYPVVSKFRTKKFDIAKLERRASEGDRLYFQGFVAEIEVGQAIDNYTQDNIIEQQECCTRTAYVAPVTNLSADMASGSCGNITLSRTASTTAGVTYTIREGTATLFSGLAVLTKDIGGATGEHTYKVYAVKSGSESVMADVTITAAYCPPVAPSGAAVSAYSCGTTVDLTWTGSPTSGVTYNVYDGVALLANTGATTSYSATGLSVASHTFNIKALKNGVESTTATSVTQVVALCSIEMTIASAAAFGGNPYNVLVTGAMTLNGHTATEKGIIYYETGNPGTNIGDAGVTKVISTPTLPEGVYTTLNIGMAHNKSFVFKTYCIDSGAVKHYSPTTVTYVTPV